MSQFSIEAVHDTFDHIEGRPVLGELDMGMRGAFVELVEAETRFMEIHEEMKTRIVSNAAGKVFDHGNNIQAAFDDILRSNNWKSDEEASEYLRLQSHHQELFWAFWNRVRGEFNSWNTFLSIRKGWKIVVVGKKAGPATT